ncbi:MAG: sigma-70 family RNA polymerase sigma factor [Sporichthyaceae bacterium]
MTADSSVRSAPRPAGADEGELLDRLRRGDETAFTTIVTGWSPMMLRVARGHVSTEASCEEIVQETWMAVIRGLDGFEGRSSLRTWVFRILTNLAKTRGVREARSVPMSSWAPADDGPTVNPNRFRPADDGYQHNWTPVGAPTPWLPGPEQSAVAGETRRLLGIALQELPERQRTVVTLRDVHGMSSDEVCATLGLSAANQRVLLHRGRARLRAVLEDYYRGAGVETS